MKGSGEGRGGVELIWQWASGVEVDWRMREWVGRQDALVNGLEGNVARRELKAVSKSR